MIKRAFMILIIVLLSSINIHAQSYNDVEIFDITQGKVVKVVKSNSAFQKEAVTYLENISGVYAKFNPIPEKGHAIRIPLTPSVKAQNSWTNTLVHEVIIVFPDEQGTLPFLMFFEDDDKLMCFEFKGDTRNLLRLLDFKIPHLLN
jgi:hypothetical protein